jgi:hypothetical protein
LVTRKTANAAKHALAPDTANSRAIWQNVQSLGMILGLR